MTKVDKRSITSKENGKKGGVKTEAGKNISKRNAQKHGIFASYATELDDESFEDVYDKYVTEFGDTTLSRAMLIRELAILHIRLKRCARFESEYITSKLHPPKYERKLVKEASFKLDSFDDEYENVLVDPGKPMTLPLAELNDLENVYLKYEAQFLSRYCHIVDMLSHSKK